MDNRGIDSDLGWINRKFQELERKLEAMRSERRAGSTTISGGSFVVDGGDVLLLDVDGSVIFRLGPQQYDDRGVSINRADGTLALAVRKAFPAASNQTVEIRDDAGFVIFSEEPLGFGLSRPFLHIPMNPVQPSGAALAIGPYGVQVPIATGTFTSTHTANFSRHNQFGVFKLQIAASDATTAGEVQIINNDGGAVLADFLSPPWLGSRPAGTTNFVVVDSPRINIPGNPDVRISLSIQVRRSAGAGTLFVALTDSHGQ